MKNSKMAKSDYERVLRYRTKLMRSGAVRVQVLLADPEVISALNRLVQIHGNRTAAISEAIRVADRVKSQSPDLSER